jgi:K+-transporting ATPase A subunit
MLATSFGNGDIFLWMVEFFLFVIWFWLLIAIFGDLFRDHETSGGMKAFWIFFIIIIPFVGILVYLIARGGGMAERAAKSQQQSKEQFDAYVRSTAGAGQSPAEQIASAKALLDAGTIDQSEYDRLKAKALG